MSSTDLVGRLWEDGESVKSEAGLNWSVSTRADMDDDEELLVLVDDAYLDVVNDVAGRLEEAGMRVDRVLPEIGTLVGRAPRAAGSGSRRLRA